MVVLVVEADVVLAEVVVTTGVEVALVVVVLALVVVVGEPDPAKAASRMGMYALYATPCVGSRPYI